MNRKPPRFLRRPAHRLLLAALLSLPVSGACSSSSDAPSTPITYNVEVATLDGNAPTDNVVLRCDHDRGKAESTLAVSVTITSTPANEFVLRPANACGTATRCGFVRVQGLTSDDQVLEQVDTATTTGVLVFDLGRLPELSKIRASLIKGVDETPLLNPDRSEVTATVSPSFTVPSDCVDEVGAGGAAGAPNGGAGGENPGAGAGGMPPGGAGAGGAPLGGMGGAGGDDTAAPGGAAGASGAAPSAGAGGA